MSDYEKLLNATVFKNAARFDNGTPMTGGKPNYSNNKLRIERDLPAGEYSLAIWQYADSGNLSISLTKPTSPVTGQTQGGIDDDFS